MNPAAEEPKSVANPYYTYGILYLSPNFHAWEASQGARYREYRLGWAQRAAARDHGAFPLNVNMEVTSRCNLACTFCSQPSLTNEQLGDMPWELYTRIIAEGEHYQVPAANLNGLGEPMLLRRLPEMIAYAKQRGYLDVMFHTNGTVMTEALARALLDANLDRMIFSVDSPDKATYEAMRIRSNWDKVVANVRLFAEVRNRLGRTTPLIRTTMVVTENTSHQVTDFLALWKPLADQVTLQDLTWRTKTLEGGEWKNREQSAIPTDMEAIRAQAKQQKLSFVCPYLYQSAYAFWNGDVIPCSNPNARNYMVMGNLKTQSLHEVWHGKAYTELRALHESGRWDEHPICRNCEVPLIELYKALEHERGQVASEMVPNKDEAVDLVTQFKQQVAVKALADE
ncbi:MAG: hypothetical protein A3G88_07010 [Omnitrophica WOR_2 bacterium RIFCSPLOWO2_12_FULL_63_16]|nr:MAG: hypothetical protein A3G88_07010 [Omnitrophica WOR_2 bacterium RIFCSPLOWO2_12_FULL_63_16]